MNLHLNFYKWLVLNYLKSVFTWLNDDKHYSEANRYYYKCYSKLSLQRSVTSVINFNHHWLLLIIIEHYWSSSSITNDHHWLLLIIIDHCWSSSIIIDHCWSSLITVDHHRSLLINIDCNYCKLNYSYHKLNRWLKLYTHLQAGNNSLTMYICNICIHTYVAQNVGRQIAEFSNSACTLCTYVCYI